MWTLLWAEAVKELAQLQYLFVQEAALLGILSLVLMVCRGGRFAEASTQTAHGLVLGISAVLLTALVHKFVEGPFRPYIRHDILFLAGLLGGWRGGVIGFGFVTLTWFHFSDLAYAWTGLVGTATLAAGGVFVHYAMRGVDLLNMRVTDLLKVWLARLGFGFLSILLVYTLGLISGELALLISARRVVSAIPTLCLLAGLFAILRIDARHRLLQKQEAERTFIHPITGLSNRRALRDHLDTQFKQGGEQSHVLLLIEASNYVEMLLVQGSDWSDFVWQNVEQLLSQALIHRRVQEYSPRVFQFSDTALAVVLHHIDSGQVEQQGIACELQQELSLALSCQSRQGHVPQLRLSVVNACCRDHVTAAQALRDASLHLQKPVYVGEITRFFHQAFSQEAALDAELLTMMMHWIDTDTPPVAYQPKCSLRTCEVEGAEALLRASDARHVQIPPMRVLELAARHQLTAALEWCTIKAVVRDARRCLRQAPAISLAVNISGASLSMVDFAERVQGLLLSADLPMKSLTLELTESSPLPKVDAVRQNLQQLQAFGIPVSLDDFGSGYSGLTLLAQYPFSEVKIDYAMVAMIDSPRMKAAIQLALESAQRYDASFVAEGVETQSQCDTLSDMGIGVGQGYLFAPALCVEELLSYIRNASCAHGLARAA